MKKSISLLLVAILFIGFSCGQTEKSTNGADVKIETEFGDILIKLYDETPKHRDNFIKLVKDGFYDDLLFHRVIQGFMIQGGDPDSKDAEFGQRLGSGDPEYTIPAEFNSTLFHKKGALAAAREPDQVNPEKRSSGSQFYLVQGRTFSNDEIDDMIYKMESQRAQAIMRKHFTSFQEELNQLRTDGKQEELSIRIAEIREDADAEVAQLDPITISKQQREAYSTIGGYPSLDGNYTVFGEIVEGLDVLDKIAAVETDNFDRPVADVKMKVKVLD
ncbi:peptidylprolyl isomerase [Sunxiuqinia sp. A32]|uniref:peptidylprolyl isomerase n=1 Tax=Sunxiuqinia sp. A32 TaxID=3461496 RepID=UPI004045CF8A